MSPHIRSIQKIVVALQIVGHLVQQRLMRVRRQMGRGIVAGGGRVSARVHLLLVLGRLLLLMLLTVDFRYVEGVVRPILVDLRVKVGLGEDTRVQIAIRSGWGRGERGAAVQCELADVHLGLNGVLEEGEEGAIK